MIFNSKDGMEMGAVIAMILSWHVNKSILWMILHALCSWGYVLYYVFYK